MIRTRKPRWCVAERRPTGPDKIFYISGTFETKKEAELERARLAALPEKQGYRLLVTIPPDERPKRGLRKTSRRSTR